MVDIHSHVLPGIDDGPKDMAGSVAMADVAARAGIRILAATPHVREDHPRVEPAEIGARVAELNEVLGRHNIGVRVVPGAEVALSAFIDMSDDELRSITLGGNERDLLVETPFSPLPSVFEELLEGLTRRGFRVTIAHPELGPSLQQDPRRLERLVSAGIQLQLTATSFTGPKRSRSRALALAAVRDGLAHAIASDGHSATWRPPDLNPGLEAARRALPGAGRQLDWMTGEAPRAIVEGRELPPRPEGGRPRRGLGLFRRS